MSRSASLFVTKLGDNLMARKRFIIALVFYWMCLGSSAWSETYEEAYSAYANEDFKTAETIAKKLVLQKDPYSAYMLGRMYLYGKGVEQSTLEAVRLNKVAIGNGFNISGLGSAAVTLGWIYQTGEYAGVSKDAGLARFWNNFGAYLGHPGASDNLAQIYANGFGVNKDPAIVVKYLKESLANYTVAENYLLSEPDEWLKYVVSDQAVIWDARLVYRKAIKTGDDSYKFELDQIYNNLANSKKIESSISLKDLQLAFELENYKLAVQQAKSLSIDGDAAAQFYLGKIYENGLGVLQRNINAHMWYNIASFNGSVPAITAREALTKRMTEAAIEKAQDQAVKCMQSNYRACQLDIVPKSVEQKSFSYSASELTDKDIQGLKTLFLNQTTVERKHTQYALKFFGLYGDKIDGLWGTNTIRALKSFQKIQSIEPKTPKKIIDSLVGELELPVRFIQAPRAQKSISTSQKNPQLELLILQRQALELQREAARMRAEQQALDRLYDFGMSLAYPKY